MLDNAYVTPRDNGRKSATSCSPTPVRSWALKVGLVRLLVSVAAGRVVVAMAIGGAS